MEAIEIARRLSALGQTKDACQAYALAVHQGAEPIVQMEAAAYILQNGGDYRISYGCFTGLYNQGVFREDILPLMEAVFYEPNVKQLKSRYERNCKRLAKYSYLFRTDFVPFEELPIRFFPYDDHNGYVPFYRAEDRFGEFVNFGEQVISRNFFKDLDKPILAKDVFSQYELEYLNDNVRRSEDIGRENHIYLHYTDWAVFCSYLQCLNLRKVLESRKLVFLIGDEISRYPIDFKKQYGIDYSQSPVKPLGIREVQRLIWHTQLATHNGGDFFNEVFDAHPNLLALTSIMFSDLEEQIGGIRKAIRRVNSAREAIQLFHMWPPHIAQELFRIQNPTDKDILAAWFLGEKRIASMADPNARIAPAIFLQPHFPNVNYELFIDDSNRTVLSSEQYDGICTSPIFRGFKYIKTFTPIRRITNSHAASVRYMYDAALAYKEDPNDKKAKRPVVIDAVVHRVLNRSYLIDWQDRLFKDSILVRFEDGKLNPKATFTALAAFLDLPYTESLTQCTEFGKTLVYGRGLSNGFDPSSIYRTYDDYANDDERCFIEYFMRDAYEIYGYDFNFYDGTPMDEERATALTRGFSTIDHYVRESWRRNMFNEDTIQVSGEGASMEIAEGVRNTMAQQKLVAYAENRVKIVKLLMRGLNFVNRNGQPLRPTPLLKLDPALLEQPLYH